jgi:hemoglobin
MRTRLLLCSVILGAGLAGVVACGKKPPPKEPTITETVSDAGADDAVDAEPPKPKSLFERIGGKEGIAKVVNSFFNNVTHNDVLKKRFTKLPKERVEKMRTNMIAQICKESGGDCEYTGKSLKEAHKGMKITEPEWNATVSALKAAFDENKIGDNEQNDLIAAIAPMKDDIVEVKPKPKR